MPRNALTGDDLTMDRTHFEVEVEHRKCFDQHIARAAPPLLCEGRFGIDAAFQFDAADD